MTKEEIQAKSQEKVNAIQTLCKQLQVVVTAEQMITEKGFIKQVVYYTDSEKYDMEPQKIINPNDVKKYEPNHEDNGLSDDKAEDTKEESYKEA